jgi:DNA-binding XRE family transcriptional regulator
MKHIKPKTKLAGKLREHGITIRRLARELNVSEATVNNWLKGATSPGIDIWIDITRILNEAGADETIETIY